MQVKHKGITKIPNVVNSDLTRIWIGKALDKLPPKGRFTTYEIRVPSQLFQQALVSRENLELDITLDFELNSTEWIVRAYDYVDTAAALWEVREIHNPGA